jgi:hypothetical protein
VLLTYEQIEGNVSWLKTIDMGMAQKIKNLVVRREIACAADPSPMHVLDKSAVDPQNSTGSIGVARNEFRGNDTRR